MVEGQLLIGLPTTEYPLRQPCGLPRLAYACRLRGCDMPPACRWSPLRPPL